MISKRVASLLSFLLLAGVGAALALPSCDPYSPSYEDLKCGPGGACPGDLTCVQDVCRAGVAEECGDGMAVGSEVCDDGNTDDGDGCNATCTTASCYIPVTYATLAEGLADTACATLYVQSGTYAGRFEINRDVSVVGVGAMPITLDGEQLGSVVSVAAGTNATLRNLTIKNGKALAGGGIINRGTVDLEHVTVTENIAEDGNPNGGGIENLTGTVTLTRSVVSKNRLVSTSTTGSVFTGAGIHSTGGTITLTDESYVEENDLSITGISGATARGGGIGTIGTIITIGKSSAVRRNDLFVNGRPGNASVFGAGVYVSGGGLTVNGDSEVSNNIAAAEGITAGGNLGANSAGGGVYATGSMLTLNAALLKENQATARGEAGTTALGGAVAVRSGTLVTMGAVFKDNAVTALGLGSNSLAGTAGGGGLDIDTTNAFLTDTLISESAVNSGTESATSSTPATGGGLRLNIVGTISRTVELTRTTVENNTVTSTDTTAAGAGVYAAVSANTTTEALILNLASATISGNKVQSPSFAAGGGVRINVIDGTDSITMNAVNSTISGNKLDGLGGSASGGGIYATTGGGSAKVNLNFASATIAANSVTAGGGTSGGGISLTTAAAPAAIAVTIKNTILADNVAFTNPDCSFANAITSNGYNLLGVPTGCTFSATTGHLTGAAGLGPLASNGGNTKTHSLNAGSQAINAGNPAGCTDLAPTPVALTTDQRGLARVARGRCDIGAYEAQ